MASLNNSHTDQHDRKRYPMFFIVTLNNETATRQLPFLITTFAKNKTLLLKKSLYQAPHSCEKGLFPLLHCLWSSSSSLLFTRYLFFPQPSLFLLHFYFSVASIFLKWHHLYAELSNAFVIFALFMQCCERKPPNMEREI